MSPAQTYPVYQQAFDNYAPDLTKLILIESLGKTPLNLVQADQLEVINSRLRVSRESMNLGMNTLLSLNINAPLRELDMPVLPSVASILASRFPLLKKVHVVILDLSDEAILVYEELFISLVSKRPDLQIYINYDDLEESEYWAALSLIERLSKISPNIHESGRESAHLY